MGTTVSGSRGGNQTRVDQAIWDKLVEAFRADPGNYSNAARHAGVERRTARRAYEVGYPDRPWGLRPIRALLTDEAGLARERLRVEDERTELEEDRAALEADRDREAARQRAIDTRAQEGRLVQATRAATMNALAAAMRGAEGLQHAMQRLGGALIALAADNEKPLSSKDIGNLSNIMRRYSSTLRELAQAGQTAMEMERLYLGEPTEMIGVVTDFDTMPLDDLVRLAGYQDSVIKRAADRGLVVLDGGLKQGKPGEGSGQ